MNNKLGPPSELIRVLMERDEMTRIDAELLIAELRERIYAGEEPEYILYDELGLEPDYLLDLIG